MGQGGMACPKPEPRAKVKARQARADAKARRRCTDAVWRRQNARPFGDTVSAWCQQCGHAVLRAHESFRLVGHVDEIVPRSQGGDLHDPDNCRLVCHDCHFSGPSHAHRVTPNWRSGRV